MSLYLEGVYRFLDLLLGDVKKVLGFVDGGYFCPPLEGGRMKTSVA